MPLVIRTARTSNSKEPQQMYRLGTVSIKILGVGGLNRFYGDPNLAFVEKVIANNPWGME